MAFGRFGLCVRKHWNDLLCKGSFRGILRSNCMTCRVGAKRHLISEDVIKLQEFQQRKLSVANQVAGAKGNYFVLFKHKLQKNELILRDELKLLLHLCQSIDDIVTAKEAIYRYHEENHNMSFGEFKFGPLFMRLCYELGLEEMAAATLTDRSLRGFFNDSTSFNIAMDMLFTKGCYESALAVLRDMKNQGVSFNKDTFTLAAGICYKLNTPDSYRICSSLVEEGQPRGHMIPRHAYCFVVALSLRQNDVPNAQAVFSQIMSTESRICQNLKVVMLAMSGSVKEAISVLSSVLVSSSPTLVRKMDFAQEVVDLLRLRSENGPHRATLEHVVSQLQTAGQVTPQSLDQMLCHTPMGRRKHVAMMEERRVSRRTLNPLKSNLLSE